MANAEQAYYDGNRATANGGMTGLSSTHVASLQSARISSSTLAHCSGTHRVRTQERSSDEGRYADEVHHTSMHNPPASGGESAGATMEERATSIPIPPASKLESVLSISAADGQAVVSDGSKIQRSPLFREPLRASMPSQEEINTEDIPSLKPIAADQPPTPTLMGATDTQVPPPSSLSLDHQRSQQVHSISYGFHHHLRYEQAQQCFQQQQLRSQTHQQPQEHEELLRLQPQSPVDSLQKEADKPTRPTLIRPVVHMQRSIELDGFRRHLCRFCGKGFSQRTSLRIHERIHTGEKPLKCKHCSKEFAAIASLVVHERGHTGERPYKCPNCDLTFKDASTRKRHQLVHFRQEGAFVTLYRCSYCQKGFNRHSNMLVHERIHTGDKPYACPQCGKRFTARSGFTWHVRSHSDERNFVCSMCEKCFKDSCTLKKHERSHEKAMNAQGIFSGQYLSYNGGDPPPPQHLGFPHGLPFSNVPAPVPFNFVEQPCYISTPMMPPNPAAFYLASYDQQTQQNMAAQVPQIPLQPIDGNVSQQRQQQQQQQGLLAQSASNTVHSATTERISGTGFASHPLGKELMPSLKSCNFEENE